MKLLKDLWYKIRLVRYSLKNPGAMSSCTYQKYPKDSEFKWKKVLNLGCGNTIYPSSNVINLDMYSRPGIQVVQELGKKPLPFEDETFDLILANHILEHVPDWWDCFSECARVLKPGGRFEVWVPGDGGSSQLGYRDHINVINSCSLFGIAGTHRNQANAWEEEQNKKYPHVKRLYLVQQKCVLRNHWWIQICSHDMIKWMTDHLRNICSEVGFILYKDINVDLGGKKNMPII